jgi:hypothetical protein
LRICAHERAARNRVAESNQPSFRRCQR